MKNKKYCEMHRFQYEQNWENFEGMKKGWVNVELHFTLMWKKKIRLYLKILVRLWQTDPQQGF